MPTDDPDLLSPEEEAAMRAAMLDSLRVQGRREEQKFYVRFPDEGPLARDKYPRHMEVMAAGAIYQERLFMAANRVGKSDWGAFETTCHLTGIYPWWWTGKRFTSPIDAWACGTTSETLRDIVQNKLLGAHDGTSEGFVPKHLIVETTRKPHGMPGSIEMAYVRHSSGGRSRIGFKTYEQGRKSFEGQSKHWIWDDEEPPMDVYQEQLTRTVDCAGHILITFTPLQGMSEVVMSFVEPTEAAADVKVYVQAGWEDVPHLSEAEKKRLRASYLPYQLAARTKGEPSMGVGAIYPIPEEDVKCKAFAIPRTWPKGYGFDVGWNMTAAPFFAQDPSTGVYYLYDMHYMSVGEPSSHARGIQARGAYLRGVIDPASRGRGQKDGIQLLQVYKDLGLQLDIADNGVEAGLLEVWTLLIEGRLKVFDTVEPWFREFRKYHRDEKGHIVKKNDHGLDATRYWAVSGRDKMVIEPRAVREFQERMAPKSRRGWMGS